MSADLHLHTVHSDGNWSPEQVVEQALHNGLRCIAITDHDTTAGISAALAAAQGLEVIPGIEINTVYTSDDGKRSDVHILGYFIDTQHSALNEIIDRQQAARKQLVTDTIEKCNALGIQLTEQLVRECSGKGSIGRPHLSAAIVRAGGASDADEAFKRFMHRKSPDFIERQSVTAQEAIACIKASGGIASLAHPKRLEKVEKLILDLKQAGLQAVEAYHRSHTIDLVKRFLKLAATHSLLVTGGSDCHGPGPDYPPSIGSVKVPLDVVRALKQSRTG